MEAKISVIIPAYNAAAFLPACLESVLGQAMPGIEVIVVNDGSTDGTRAVCDDYARKDPRVRVTHKANAGVSEARNTGIEQATGEYFWFVDADDTIAPGACGALYSLAKEHAADAVVFDYRRSDGGRDAGTFPSVFEAGVYEGGAVVSELLERFLGFSNAGIHRWLRREPDGLYVENPALWRAFLRGGLIRENRLRFDPTLRVGEDTIFISLCLSHAARAVVTHQVFYCQLLHGGSTVARYEKDPEAKLANKLALLAARRALTGDIAARRGMDVGPGWQGTVVMSYMELCFLYARPAPGVGFKTRYRRFLCYAKDPYVAECLSAFTLPPRPGARSLPFWLMKRRRHGVLFFCAALLSLTGFRFKRE